MRTHRPCPLRPSPPGRGRQRGGALVEYTIVALCLVLILVAVPNDVIHKLMDAVKNAYASFAYALSISWF